MAEAAAQIRAPIERTAPDTIRLERMLDAPVETVGAISPRRTFAGNGSWAAPDARPDGAFDLLVDHDNLSTDEVPYAEGYAAFKGTIWTEKVIRFSRRGCSRRPSKAARTE